MAVSFIGAGAAAADTNANLTPGGVASSQIGDLYVAFLTARTAQAGSTFTQGSWNLHSSFPHTNGSNPNKLWLFWKVVASDGEAGPTFTYSGSANETVIGQIACFRGTDTNVPFRQIGTFYDGGSTANIGAITGISVLANNAALVIGHRADDWTSVATLTADTDSYNEIGEPDSQAGTDAGMVWDYLLATANRSLANRTFTVTGGNANPGCGVFLEIQVPIVRAQHVAMVI